MTDGTSASDLPKSARPARNLCRRHHDACGRCHRQCRQPQPARRRRCRWRHPPRGGSGIVGGVRDARRLRDRLGQDHAAAIGCRPSTSSTPSVRSGTAAATAKKSCWPPAIARRSILPAAIVSARSPFRRSRPASIASRPIVRPGSRSAPSSPKSPRATRHEAGRVLLLFARPRRISTATPLPTLAWPERPKPCNDGHARLPCGIFAQPKFSKFPYIMLTSDRSRMTDGLGGLHAAALA